MMFPGASLAVLADALRLVAVTRLRVEARR